MESISGLKVVQTHEGTVWRTFSSWIFCAYFSAVILNPVLLAHNFLNGRLWKRASQLSNYIFRYPSQLEILKHGISNDHSDITLCAINSPKLPVKDDQCQANVQKTSKVGNLLPVTPLATKLNVIPFEQINYSACAWKKRAIHRGRWGSRIAHAWNMRQTDARQCRQTLTKTTLESTTNHQQTTLLLTSTGL